MTELSEWLGIERTTVSTWCRAERNNIPEKHIRDIESRGYPREKWYIEEEIREEFTLGDEVTAEVIRGGATVPEDPYQPTPEHMLPGSKGQPISLVVDRDASDRSDIDKHRVTTLFEGEDSEYLEMVQRILSSDDVTTKTALKANIRVFDDHVKTKHDHIKTKEEMEDLKKEVQRLKKSIASSPNPGKDGTDEA